MKDKIIQFIKTKGPVLPSQIAKILETNIIIASAHLSELVSNGKLKISHLKVGGGSPLYYLPGQEKKLLNFTDNLDPKDRKTLEKIKEKRILREKDLDSFTRVSLRNIKDFAKPLQVKIKGQKELFWRFFTIDKEEALQLIKEKITGKKQKVINKESEEEKQRTEKKEPEKRPEEEEKSQEEKTDTEKEKSKEKKQDKTSQKENKTEPPDKTETKKQKKEQDKKERQKEEKENKNKEKPKTKFNQKIHDFFKEKNIEIIKEDIIRKKSDTEFILNVPTVIGKVKYFCKARNKKRCTDKDVSQAYAQGNIKNLPTLFIYTKNITKKGKKLKEDIENLKIINLSWD